MPYFLVLPKARARDGSIPTLLYGYGGFEVSQTPGYYAAAGAAWLDAAAPSCSRTFAVVVNSVHAGTRRR